MGEQMTGRGDTAEGATGRELAASGAAGCGTAIEEAAEHRTFTEVFRARAAERPHGAALIVLTEPARTASAPDGLPAPELQEETLRYDRLDARARELARRLRPHAAPGERVLLLLASRRDFAVGFLACLYAGAVAVPLAPTDGRGHHDERLAGVVKDAAAVCALTSAAEAPGLSQLLARTGHGTVSCVLVDRPALQQGSSEGEFVPVAAAPDTVAFLQYTSGSTREPRGVVVTHRALLANQRALQAAFGTRPGERIGGWLPFHHDMGLVGQLLHALWLGGTAVLLSPESFVRRPARWLEAVSRYGLTVSGAPDFAYELCVRRVNDAQLAGLDLSGWRTAVSGGEPVREQTLREFADRFAPAGLRPEALVPAYGLAEATLLVSGSAAPAPWSTHALGEDGRALVTAGPPAPGTEIRIVDPDTLRAVPDGVPGEIWVRGDSVAKGYWARPAETAETFRAKLTGGGSGFLRTGDLGLLHDGRLYVTGRRKDVIVVAGRNVHPQDLERTVQRVDALFGSGIAFGVPGSREQVVLVQELRARSRYEVDLAGLVDAVRATLAEEHEIHAAAVLLVRPGTVRRTTSGKVERAAMRRLFLRGELTALHQHLDPEVADLLPAPPATRSRT
ncbi:fatty acyl-AMP ligase [Streptomyces sp. NPDC087440]|uniref:fatty acyl-AMP ligase n=1 Tax=Streptomyces sp. NPDC087440 TaxID=3365790 RepID=UPI0037FAE7FD